MNPLSSKTAFTTSLLALTLSIATPSLSVLSFTDVPNTFWADRYIDFLSDHGILTGYPDNTFRPTQPVTRAEFAVMLAKSQNLATTGSAATQSFRDVPRTHWAATAIQAVANQGWIKGYPGNQFRPNQPISMAEMYTVIANVSHQPLVDNAQATALLNQFQDASQVPDWAITPVATAAKLGIYVKELNPNSLIPTLPATRSSVATTLAKLLNPSFRSPITVAQQKPPGGNINIIGILQPTGTAGEWSIAAENGKQFVLENPQDYVKQPWFRVGNKVHLQGQLDAETSTPDRQVAIINTMETYSTAQNRITVTGTLRPSIATPEGWLVETPNHQVYRILNPNTFSNQSWFRFGSQVSVSGTLRPDVTLAEGEGTGILAATVEKATNAQQQELSLSGTLQPTVESGGWTLTIPNTNQKYVLLGTEAVQNQPWFKAGTHVEVKGSVQQDVPTIYMEGPVLKVTAIQPNPADITGQQSVKLYYPSLINVVQNPSTLLGQPIVRTLEGPNLPNKAIEALLKGPSNTERLLGYFQDPEIQQLSLGQLQITGGKATVVLKAPSNDFSFRQSIVPQRLGQAVNQTLLQFPGIESVDIAVIGPDNQVIWSSSSQGS